MAGDERQDAKKLKHLGPLQCIGIIGVYSHLFDDQCKGTQLRWRTLVGGGNWPPHPDSHCANPPNHTENAWNHGFSDALYQAVRPRVLFWRGQALGQKEFGHMASEKRHGMRWEEG